jgi:hypothetical protein
MIYVKVNRQYVFNKYGLYMDFCNFEFAHGEL